MTSTSAALLEGWPSRPLRQLRPHTSCYTLFLLWLGSRPGPEVSGALAALSSVMDELQLQDPEVELHELVWVWLSDQTTPMMPPPPGSLPTPPEEPRPELGEIPW